ncbi:MAG: hypothetical protein ACI360_00905 [Atopobiaceae bacterium]
MATVKLRETFNGSDQEILELIAKKLRLNLTPDVQPINGDAASAGDATPAGDTASAKDAASAGNSTPKGDSTSAALDALAQSLAQVSESTRFDITRYRDDVSPKRHKFFDELCLVVGRAAFDNPNVHLTLYQK